MILPFFESFFNWIQLKLLDFPFFESFTGIEHVKGYISDTNRMIIYILGTTVSANIYLYNSKAKISASSIWDVKQLLLLILNIGVNMLILFVGLHLLHNELVFNLDHSNDDIRTIMIIHILLVYLSYLLFFVTLWMFIKSFWQSYNMKSLYRKLEKLVYHKNWYNLLLNVKVINSYSDNKLKKHIGKIQLTNRKVKRLFDFILKMKSIHLLTKYSSRLLKYGYRFYHYVYIAVIENHIIIEQSRVLKKSEIKKMSVKLEILSQNLGYIISSNSDKGMKDYCEDWNALFSKIITMLFHIKSNPKNEDDILDLYRLIIHNQVKLITITLNNHEQRKYHLQFITSLFTAGLAYKEEGLKLDYFKKRAGDLENIYFEELFELLINLIKNNNFEIFSLLKNEEISLNSFMASKSDHDKYYGNRDRKKKYEQLFTSLLIKMVELNITDNMTTIMAVILSLREEVIDTTKNNKSSAVILPKKKNSSTIEDTTDEFEVKLSYENKMGLIYAAIKANEVENLKAAGYITKILCSNIKFSSLIGALTEINLTIEKKRNHSFTTGIYKLNFNDFSYTYCLNKTLVLILTQYFSKNEISDNKDVDIILNQIDYVYILDKLGQKEKEYNMLALNSLNIKKFKNHIKQLTHSKK